MGQSGSVLASYTVADIAADKSKASKGAALIRIAETASLLDVLNLLHQHKIMAVWCGEGLTYGLVSVTDVMRFLALQRRKDPAHFDVHELLTTRKCKDAFTSSRTVNAEPTLKLDKLLEIMINTKLHRVALLNQYHTDVVEIITQTSIIRFLKKIMFKHGISTDATVSDIGLGLHPVIGISENASVLDAISLMEERHVQGLVVYNDANHMVAQLSVSFFRGMKPKKIEAIASKSVKDFLITCDEYHLSDLVYTSSTCGHVMDVMAKYHAHRVFVIDAPLDARCLNCGPAASALVQPDGFCLLCTNFHRMRRPSAQTSAPPIELPSSIPVRGVISMIDIINEFAPNRAFHALLEGKDPYAPKKGPSLAGFPLRG